MKGYKKSVDRILWAFKGRRKDVTHGIHEWMCIEHSHKEHVEVRRYKTKRMRQLCKKKQHVYFLKI